MCMGVHINSEVTQDAHLVPFKAHLINKYAGALLAYVLQLQF